MHDAEVIRNKMLRGQILRTLSLFYPSAVEVQGIKSSLLARGLIISMDIAKLLYYLKDKGYIKISNSDKSEINDSDCIELTAKGVDLIEGTETDLGVDV